MKPENKYMEEREKNKEEKTSWTLISYTDAKVPLPPYTRSHIIAIVKNNGTKSIAHIERKYIENLSIGITGKLKEMTLNNKEITYFIPDIQFEGTERNKQKTKVALVTGSPRGIGRAIALELAHQGFDVVVNNSKKIEEGTALVNEIKNLGRKSIYLPTDISDPIKVEEMIEQIITYFGSIDVLVNNAGITRDKKLENLDFEQWQKVIAVNLTGTFNCTKSTIKHMKKQGGKIINISSIVGKTGNFGQANYAASKGGIVSFTKTIAKEYAPDNILCNAVAPGFIKTKMLETIPEGIMDKIIENIPLGRLGKAEEVAHLVAFLVSDKANWITGQTFHINGGQFM